MPKEQMHFAAARRTAASTPQGVIAQAARDHDNALLLGSVFHDILYYMRGRTDSPGQRLAAMLHGDEDMDSYALLKAQTRHATKQPDPGFALAMLAGMASHICLDAAMHPFIWHVTGDYDHPDPKMKSRARQHHRAFETLMDMTLAPAPDQSTFLSVIADSLHEELADAWPAGELAQWCGADELSLHKEFDKALRTYALVQRVGNMPVIPRMTHALWNLLPGSAREVAALLRSPQWLLQKSILEGPCNYIHPATGTPASESIDVMFERAVTKTRALWASLEQFMNGASLPHGPNLDTGLEGNFAMHYFASPLLPRLPDEM